MKIIHEFPKALLDMQGKVPTLSAPGEGSFYALIGREHWPLHDCTVEKRHGNTFVIRGTIPQVEFNCDWHSKRELSPEEAERYEPKHVITGRRFWTGEPYAYLRSGWVRLREPKPVSITIHGQLVIVEDQANDTV